MVPFTHIVKKIKTTKPEKNNDFHGKSKQGLNTEVSKKLIQEKMTQFYTFILIMTVKIFSICALSEKSRDKFPKTFSLCFSHSAIEMCLPTATVS